MRKLYVMIGIPGSGKSTIAKNIAKLNNCKVVSTDDIRKEINGSEECQANGQLIFDTAYERIGKFLDDDECVVFDATNTKSEYRSFIFRYYETEYIAVFVDTPFGICLHRNDLRERKVPKDVINRMYLQLETPELEEGFNKIYRIEENGYYGEKNKRFCQ